MADKIERWDIWWADVPFEDIAKSKKRPVLILENKKAFVLSMKMTSHPPRSGEYQIQDLASAGLAVPTTIRTGKVLLLDKSRLLKKMGHLSKNDILMLTIFHNFRGK